MDFLRQIDIALMQLVNVDLSNGVFNYLMPFLTDFGNFALPLVFLLLLLFFYGGKRGKTAVIFGLVVVLIADQVSSSIIKPLVERPRPCQTLPWVRLLMDIGKDCPASFSMPSSHAANASGVAIFFSTRYRGWVPAILLTVAAAVCYSRIYVGVHYPSDVVIGVFIGVSAALVTAKVEKPLVGYFERFVTLRKEPAS